MPAERILVVDPRTAGISGDMMVAALLDAGAGPAAVVAAMQTPAGILEGCSAINVAVEDTARAGLRAKKVHVEVTEQHIHRTPHDLVGAATACLQRISLSEQAKRFAFNSLDALISAEAAVHGSAPQDLVLHETGSADTLADVIGAAVALDDLNAFANTVVFATPVGTGAGSIHIGHGSVASPAPATLEILRASHLSMVGLPAEGELATPTGAALLAALNPIPTTSYPPMTPTRVGYGAGDRQPPGIPNVLRLVFGEPIGSHLASDEVWVIETNIDDAAGETIAYAMQEVLNAGARDIAAIPVLAKKARPGHILQVLADGADVERLSSILIDQTGSLGVRIHPCERRILRRDLSSIHISVGDTPHEIRVKVARDTSGRVIRVKPEHDDLVKVARIADRPLREVEAIANRTAAEVLDIR
jgi:uncharacterized protein (TIGR00299 family) protein